jgi:pimeloyl-ACP methyl ester carboxylesterase
MVAASMAAIRPRSICGVALVDAGWEDVEEVTGLTAAEFERSIGDPPEVMASVDAYLADRREFDRQTWDPDQERAARAAVEQKHAGHVALVTRPHALRGSVDAIFEYRPLQTLGTLEMPILVAVAASGAADDELARERQLALDDVIRARAERGLSAMTVRRFAGAGHNLMRYRPVELSSAMIDLLTEATAHQRS